MPQITTRDFGEMTCAEEAILEFPRGLPGFEGDKRFVLIEQPDLDPVVFLQSLTTPSTCLLTIPVTKLDAAYQIGMTPEDARLLDLDAAPRLGPDVLCLTVLTAGSDGSCTANLLAPVVINLRKRIGVQAVRADRRYSHAQPLRPLSDPEHGTEDGACS
jgi:flagellar assembly factor FliW